MKSALLSILVIALGSSGTQAASATSTRTAVLASPLLRLSSLTPCPRFAAGTLGTLERWTPGQAHTPGLLYRQGSAQLCPIPLALPGQRSSLTPTPRR